MTASHAIKHTLNLLYISTPLVERDQSQYNKIYKYLGTKTTKPQINQARTKDRPMNKHFWNFPCDEMMMQSHLLEFPFANNYSKLVWTGHVTFKRVWTRALHEPTTPKTIWVFHFSPRILVGCCCASSKYWFCPVWPLVSARMHSY